MDNVIDISIDKYRYKMSSYSKLKLPGLVTKSYGKGVGCLKQNLINM
jgi:hypothetical protein